MPLKVVATKCGSAELRVENRWLSGAKLLFNGKCIAKNTNAIALDKSKPVMTSTVQIDGSDRLVEVYAYAPGWAMNLKICVDGEYLAGDRF